MEEEAGGQSPAEPSLPRGSWAVGAVPARGMLRAARSDGTAVTVAWQGPAGAYANISILSRTRREALALLQVWAHPRHRLNGTTPQSGQIVPPRPPRPGA